MSEAQEMLSFGWYVVQRLVQCWARAEGDKDVDSEVQYAGSVALAERTRFLKEAADLYMFQRDVPLPFALALERLVRDIRRSECKPVRVDEDDMDEDGGEISLLLRSLLQVLKQLSSEYCSQWDRASQLVDANLHIRMQMKASLEHRDADTQATKQQSERVHSIDGLEFLQEFISRDRLSFIMFSAPYCPYCEQLRPAFAEASSHASVSGVVFAKTNVSEVQRLKEDYVITTFPTLILFRAGKRIDQYPTDAPRDAKSLVSFVADHIASGKLKESDGNASDSTTAAQLLLKKKFRKVVQVALYRAQLSLPRKIITVAEMYKALGCAGDDCIVQRGGGMGAGKSTVVQYLMKEKQWTSEIQHPVVVEADRLKMSDPLFHKLSELHHSDASRSVHADSVESANELLCKAVKLGRNIVLDGTMTWAPYIQQTIEMIVDTDHNYCQGPGYVVDDDGKVLEETYWVVDEDDPKRKCTTPYEVHMVGVTVEPDVAVTRGIQRHIITGRGVPIHAQLRSHRLFAQNFEQYVQWCDKVDLYDNNDDSPVLIASKHTRDDGLEVLHAAKYEMFQFNVHINENCKGPEDIFKVAPPRQSSTDTPWQCDRGCLLEGLFKGIERDQ